MILLYFLLQNFLRFICSVYLKVYTTDFFVLLGYEKTKAVWK